MKKLAMISGANRSSSIYWRENSLYFLFDNYYIIKLINIGGEMAMLTKLIYL